MGDTINNIVENGDTAPAKSAKQLAKEAAKQAKLDKLKQKLEKQQNVAPKKDKEEVSIFIYSIYFLNVCLIFRRKKKRKKAGKLQFIILKLQKARKKTLRNLYLMLTVLNMWKQLGTVGGKWRNFLNQSMG